MVKKNQKTCTTNTLLPAVYFVRLIIESICRNFSGLKEDQFDKYLLPIIYTTFELKKTHEELLNLISKKFTSINLIKSNI